MITRRRSPAEGGNEGVRLYSTYKKGPLHAASAGFQGGCWWFFRVLSGSSGFSCFFDLRDFGDQLFLLQLVFPRRMANIARLILATALGVVPLRVQRSFPPSLWALSQELAKAAARSERCVCTRARCKHGSVARPLESGERMTRETSAKDTVEGLIVEASEGDRLGADVRAREHGVGAKA